MLKIISGGQTGVDRAALDVALKLGISCGGYCPKGRKSEDGVIPEKYPLTETATDKYPERTELNVRNSDGTIILIIDAADRGSRLTMDFCKRYERPCVVINLTDEKPAIDIRRWLQQNNVSVLNIAGNRESISPGIHNRAYEVLMQVFNGHSGTGFFIL